MYLWREGEERRKERRVDRRRKGSNDISSLPGPTLTSSRKLGRVLGTRLQLSL